MSPWRGQSGGTLDLETGQSAYFDHLFETLDPTHHYPLIPGVQVAEWQIDLRDVLSALLGLHNSLAVPFAARVVREVEEEDYFIEHVIYQTEKGTGTPASFFRPKTPRGDGQAVLSLHGEGEGVNDPRYPYSREFARRGYYVLAPELRDFGRRRDADLDSDQAHDLLVLFGKNLVALHVLECLKGLEYLLSRPEVNRQFVGVCGMGIGAQVALFSAGLDERFACCGICGFFSTYRDLFYTNRNARAYVVPDILNYCDVSDLAGLIAPRPLIIECAENDKNLTHRETLRAYRQAQQIYEAYRQVDRVVLAPFPGELRFHGTEIYAWFSRWLAPKA